jgi:phosphinothricin acetyltransferase
MNTLIRLATPDDGPTLADIYRPAVTESAISFELDPPDGAAMAQRVARIMAHTPWLVCERDGVVLGYAYAGPHRERPAYQWSVEVSAYVHREARRMGVARALYTSLFAALVVQGFRNAYAGITLPNAASVGLHIAAGFTPVGVYRGVGYKNGAWHDVAWFERALAPREPAPLPPRSLPESIEDAAFHAALRAGAAHLGVADNW